MSLLDTLTSSFRQFPGIGPRQAKRFVYFLLSKSESELKQLADSISKLRDEITRCTLCFRFFPKAEQKLLECPTCGDPNRLNETLMVVPKDVDFETIERSKIFEGRYFILGGNVDLFGKETADTGLRLNELKDRVRALSKEGLKEIIIAANLNPEGEHTAEIVTAELSPLVKEYGLKISTLGRGLSTGTELEYVDQETIKNALKNRV